MHVHLQRAEDALRTSAGGLSTEQLADRPEGKWSAAEIVEHLGLTFSRTVKGLERLLERDTPMASPATLAGRIRTLVVVHGGHFPRGRTSPKEVRPTGANPAQVLPVTLAALRRMDALLDVAAAKFGTRVKIMDHPVLGPLNVGGWRKFHWIHTRHHARQIVARAQQRT